jgi:hypothetical protein
VQGIFSTVWGAPQNIAAIAAKPAHAASANSSDIDGQPHMGIPYDVIRRTNTIPQELVTADEPCPDTPPKTLNICQSYSSTVDALFARYTYNPDYVGR